MIYSHWAKLARQKLLRKIPEGSLTMYSRKDSDLKRSKKLDFVVCKPCFPANVAAPLRKG